MNLLEVKSFFTLLYNTFQDTDTDTIIVQVDLSRIEEEIQNIKKKTEEFYEILQLKKDPKELDKIKKGVKDTDQSYYTPRQNVWSVLVCMV